MVPPSYLTTWNTNWSIFPDNHPNIMSIIFCQDWCLKNKITCFLFELESSSELLSSLELLCFRYNCSDFCFSDVCFFSSCLRLRWFSSCLFLTKKNYILSEFHASNTKYRNRETGNKGKQEERTKVKEKRKAFINHLPIYNAWTHISPLESQVFRYCTHIHFLGLQTVITLILLS